ncbi:MAG: hypothetical protein JXA96_16760 [Sedimentisphaerales bacterium]|nr:hypothetical protein [Sedimentisphaerales bacterium]
MLRPQFQHKLKLAFLMLASALLLLAEPVFARKDNRSSSANQNTRQAPSQPATPAPVPAPVTRPAQPARSASRPSTQSQVKSVVSSPSPSVRPQSSTQSRVITNSPSPSVRTQSSTQSRIITNKPTTSVQSRSVITNTRPIQSQINSNNSISTNRNVSSKTTTTINTPSISNRSTISSGLTNSLGTSIGLDIPSSNPISSSRSNINTNRQTTRTNTNNSISRNDTLINRSKEIANSSNRASQPVASPNTRISSELSSHIGDTIGTQPTATANIRKQENNSSRNPVYLPFDRVSDSQRTTAQTKAQQPAESSNNRINSEISSRIGNQINTQNDSRQRNKQQNNRVTPPSNSDRQPVDGKSRSSIDRANTDIGVMISPERTPPSNSRQPAANPNNRTSRDNSRIGIQIGEQENSLNRIQRRNSVGNADRVDSSIGDSIRQRDISSRNDVQTRDDSRGAVRDTNTRVERRADRPQVERDRSINDSVDRTRISRVTPDTRTTIVDDLHVRDSGGRRDLRVHRYEPVRPARVVVRDRPYVRDSYHDNYLYVDLHNRVYTRTITPDYYFRVCYNRGSWLSVGFVYPYYQRKYVFVSLGGYWPSNYSYVRYYWYGSHPYNWYGYYPVAREVSSDVNYYTYNYYYGDTSGGYNTSRVLDSEYFDTVVHQPAPQPAEATLADTYFEEAVNAFEKEKYDLAIEKFSRAMALAPDDMILPYAYSQALFAAGRYSQAAQVLRKALSKVKPEQEGVFYPRGLYPNDDVLLAQLDELAEYVEEYSFDADLQLLLGYQLLGIGELDKALIPLKNASLDMDNKQPANVLLNLLLKIKVNDITSGENIEPEKIESGEIEPNTIQLNKAETENQDALTLTFVDSSVSALEMKNENEALDNANNKIVSEEIAANEPTHKKAKEGILLATIFVLAGSTGIGHFLHR